MKERWYVLQIVSAVLFVLVFQLPSSYAIAIRPSVKCDPVTGSAPVINGTISQSEWPGEPQISISGSETTIETYFHCLSDATYLYVLVDAVGDATDGPSDDECLLVFGVGDSTKEAEVWGTAGNITGSDMPDNSAVQIGFGASRHGLTPHRFYEWRIPLSSIGVKPGQAIDFASPKLLKGPGGPYASMPYDGNTGRDNEWPQGVIVADRNTWAAFQLAAVTKSVPTLNEWGMIIFMAIAGIGSVSFIKRRRKTN